MSWQSDQPRKMFGAATTGQSIRAILAQPIQVKPHQWSLCNRSACQRPLDDILNMWWNASTLAFYCQKCAIMINEYNPGLLKRRLPDDVAEMIEEKCPGIDHPNRSGALARSAADLSATSSTSGKGAAPKTGSAKSVPLL